MTIARQKIEASGRDIGQEVDGGVKTSNIADCARAGADMFVAGSAIFAAPDERAEIDAMREALASNWREASATRVEA